MWECVSVLLLGKESIEKVRPEGESATEKIKKTNITIIINVHRVQILFGCRWFYFARFYCCCWFFSMWNGFNILYSDRSTFWKFNSLLVFFPFSFLHRFCRAAIQILLVQQQTRVKTQKQTTKTVDFPQNTNNHY